MSHYDKYQEYFREKFQQFFLGLEFLKSRKFGMVVCTVNNPQFLREVLQESSKFTEYVCFCGFSPATFTQLLAFKVWRIYRLFLDCFDFFSDTKRVQYRTIKSACCDCIIRKLGGSDLVLFRILKPTQGCRMSISYIFRSSIPKNL